MHLFQYEKAEIDHLKSRDKKLGRAIDNDAAKLHPEQIILPIVEGKFLGFHALKNYKVLGG